MSAIHVYATGLVHLSVCASKHAPIESVVREVNGLRPTGLDHGWQKSDEDFASGQPNPCPCNSDPERLHWLLSC